MKSGVPPGLSSTVDWFAHEWVDAMVALPERNKMDLKPLVLLDVDGVINDIMLVGETLGTWETNFINSHGYDVAIPAYMPELIQRLCRVAEVHWCTTWRHNANDEIAAHLGVGPLPVVDDGSRSRFVDWKPAAAYEVAQKALNEGRQVCWIEDFWGDEPYDLMPEGVQFVDTAALQWRAVLLPVDLPEWLKNLMADEAVCI